MKSVLCRQRPRAHPAWTLPEASVRALSARAVSWRRSTVLGSARITRPSQLSGFGALRAGALTEPIGISHVCFVPVDKQSRAKRVKFMRGTFLLAVLLIVGGVAALAVPYFTYTQKERVVDVGPIQIDADKTKQVNIPQIAAIAALSPASRSCWYRSAPTPESAGLAMSPCALSAFAIASAAGPCRVALPWRAGW